jgi:hypothetical protein
VLDDLSPEERNRLAREISAKSNGQRERGAAAGGDLEMAEEEQQAEREGRIEEVETKFWVACDRCKKWRNLPKEVEEEVKASDPWFCTMFPGII